MSELQDGLRARLAALRRRTAEADLRTEEALLRIEKSYARMDTASMVVAAGSILAMVADHADTALWLMLIAVWLRQR